MNSNLPHAVPDVSALPEADIQSGFIQRAAGRAHFFLPAKFQYSNLPTFCIAVLPVFISQRSLFHSTVQYMFSGSCGEKEVLLLFRMVAELPGVHFIDLIQ